MPTDPPVNTEPAHVWLPAWTQRLLLVLGFAVILLPAADMAWGIDPTPPPDENRHLAEWPPLPAKLAGLQKWPTLFETWQRDHFGLRSTLIHWHSVLMLDVLGISPRQDVVLGKDGWLFLGTNKALDAYRCIFPYSEAGLANDLATFRAHDTYLAERKILHVNAWAPLKKNVYPEFLPVWIRKSGGPCRFDQLAGAAKSAQVALTDLRPAMQAAKAKGLAYHKTDTHWNPRGAYFGYLQIAAEIQKKFKTFKVLSEQEVQFSQVQRLGGDLAKMLDLLQRYAGPEVMAQLPQRCHRVPPSVTRPQNIKLEAFDCPGNGPRVLMLHDSYGNAMIPFMSESAGHLLAAQYAGFDKALIEAEKPDIVVEVAVERQLQPDR